MVKEQVDPGRDSPRGRTQWGNPVLPEGLQILVTAALVQTFKTAATQVGRGRRCASLAHTSPPVAGARRACTSSPGVAAGTLLCSPFSFAVSVAARRTRDETHCHHGGSPCFNAAAAGCVSEEAPLGIQDSQSLLNLLGKMSVTSWFLVSSSGTRHRLPKEMIFVGREDCELMLQSRSVDKQHAVINYNPNTDEHLVKDLGSLNGTFVNDLRIPDQTYITLKLSDAIRFGYDILLFAENAHPMWLFDYCFSEHEKYTSQLQMGMKVLEGKRQERSDEKVGTTDPLKHKVDKGDRKVISEVPEPRPTPLYGQPSWWGEDDTGNKGQKSERRRSDEGHVETIKDGSTNKPEVNGSLSDNREPQGKSVCPYRREPSYFEIPTKEFQPRSPEAELHEIPTKDTDTQQAPTPDAPVPSVVHSHASFTIEFDDCTPGKMKIKDHVTKFSFRQRKLPGQEVVTTPTEVMSAERKVADWLVTSDVSMMRRKAPCEDVYSTKSDLPMYIKTLKGHHHEDGTQSDSEDPIFKEKQCKSQHFLPSHPSPLSQQPTQPPQKPSSPPVTVEPLPGSPSEDRSPPRSQSRADPQQAFIIEFFDDNPRKKRSQSFTHNSAHADSYSALKAKLEKRKGVTQAGERPAPSQGNVPPTQLITVPLKGPGPGQGTPPRSMSLKREKTDERISTGPTGFSIRPFGSVGRKSKLAQDFAAEFLRESSQSITPVRGKTSPPAVITSSAPISASRPQPTGPAGSPSASPVHQPIPPMTQLLSQGVRTMDPKTSKVIRNEEEDSLSDAGTYTIETEAQDKEVEEARNMIDQVFGVLDSPEYTGVTPAAYRPVINQEREHQTSLRHSQSSSEDLKPAPEQAYSPDALMSSMILGGPKWVSRWASLADSYADSGPIPGLFDISPSGDLLEGDGRIVQQAMLNKNLDSSESEPNQSSRTRRLLPQVPPPVEKLESPTPSVVIRHETYTTHETPEKDMKSTCPQDSVQRLTVQDELDPDSLSDASKSDDGSAAAGRSGKLRPGRKERSSPRSPTEEKAGHTPKSMFLYIANEESLTKQDQVLSPAEREREPLVKVSPTTSLVRHRSSQESRRPVKPTASAPNFYIEEKEAAPTKESTCFFRQESFTKERPSDDIHVSRLPHIQSHARLGDLETGSQKQGESGQDTQSFLKETENALVALEAKLQAQGRGRSQKQEDSFSGESDVDTSSTVSLVSNQNAPGGTAKKKPPVDSLLKDRSSTAKSAQDHVRQATARERLSEKRRTQGTDSASKAEPVKRFQLRRSAGNRGSLDFSDETQSSSAPQGYWADTFSSDQETGSRATVRKKISTTLQREDTSKASKGTAHQGLTRSNSLSAPRPTRASMLRRARLGEASDNEGTETDRASQNSDANPPAKPSTDAKKLSRLDILALPRKRTGSFTTPSDTESSVGRLGFSTRSSDLSGSARKVSAPEPKPGPRRSSGAAGKQPLTRARSGSAKYSSTVSSRRRQKGSDYTSTSEDEYDSNHGTPKHKRTQASTATQTPRGQAPAPPRLRSRQSEDEENEGDPFQNWSAHSAEIARLSQDLAKDLAILAREIHDVAGDADSQGPSSAPSTPASTISTREEKTYPSSRTACSSQLVQHIPEAGLNYQKVPPGSSGVRELDQNINDQDTSAKRRTWNREEVIFDNLMLNPVSQLSQVIRENTEQLTEKMKMMFRDKTEAWEEVETRINAENEVPILKTSNKEITSILKELRRVQKQLEVINTMVEPCTVLGKAAADQSSLSPGAKFRPLSKDITPHSQSQGASHPGVQPTASFGSSTSSREHPRRSPTDPEGDRFVV
ncbi:centrosomal protein of 170 kDa protein B isoform X3 [Arapaima gigas]